MLIPTLQYAALSITVYPCCKTESTPKTVFFDFSEQAQNLIFKPHRIVVFRRKETQTP